MRNNGQAPGGNGTNGKGDEYTGLLIDRLAAAIVDDSLPLKDVERELRGCVADVAIKKRGLDKRETAARCGVTEKSIENYLKETRANPKSPEREIARALQDEMLSLEEIYEKVRPVLSQAKNFTLDDAKRSLEKLIRTGEVKEYPGHKYRAVDRPSIRYPATVEAHRELVDQKARDIDYVVLTQKEASEEDIQRRTQRFSRVVGDTNLVRIDFTVDVAEEDLPDFYEKVTAEIAKLTMKHEKKKGASRVRLLLGMRSVTALLLAVLLPLVPWRSPAEDGNRDRAYDILATIEDDSWELDNRPDNDIRSKGGHRRGINGGSSAGGLTTLRDRDAERAWQVPAGSELPANPDRMVGDVNFDNQINMTDVIVLVRYLHDEVDDLPCLHAGDADGNGALDMSDPLHLLQWLFLGSLTADAFNDEVEKEKAGSMTACDVVESE